MKMNRRRDDRKCEVCGSTKRVEGQTHYICDGRGSQLKNWNRILVSCQKGRPQQSSGTRETATNW